MSVIAEALSPAETAEIEAQLGLGGMPSNLPPAAGGGKRKTSSKRLVIPYADLEEIKSFGIPLVDFWIRVSDGRHSGIVPASKITKWISQGFQPE